MVHFGPFVVVGGLLTFVGIFDSFSKTVEGVGVFIGAIRCCSISSSIVLEKILFVGIFFGRFVRSPKPVNLRFDYLALVGVMGDIFSMVHAIKFAGIGIRVARLRGALPARGWTAMIWHSRGFLCMSF